MITVGIPFHDEAPFLARAIRSILAQTVPLELLLVDDGSRDGSLAIARSFTDSRVTVVSDGQRRHLPARLNEIVRRARQPLVARMDGDDVSHPTRLQEELARLVDDVDVVGTWAGLSDDRDEPFAVIEPGPLPPTRRSTFRGVIAHATLLARRDWLRAHPYDETLTRAEDRDLWCRSAERTRFAVVPSPLYVARVSVERPGFLADYLEAQRQNRAIARRHGPRLVGTAGTAVAVAASFARSLAMPALFRVGLARRVVQRRGRAPTAAELAIMREALL